MKSALEELFESNEDILKGVISYDNGIMTNEQGDTVDYVILQYKYRHDVYLNLFDEGKAPYRNILVKGSSINRVIAKRKATRKLNKEYQVH